MMSKDEEIAYLKGKVDSLEATVKMLLAGEGAYGSPMVFPSYPYPVTSPFVVSS
jgi:hypothetical protein